jgi:hypothetical protein
VVKKPYTIKRKDGTTIHRSRTTARVYRRLER